MSSAAHIRPESLRFQVSEIVLLGPLDASDPARARLLNLSLTGMFVQTDATYPAGTELRFEARFSGTSEKATGIVEVIWRRSVMSGPGRPAGMGCAFRRVSPSSREAIRSFLASREQTLIERIPPERLSLTEELSKMVAEAIPATPTSRELRREQLPPAPTPAYGRGARARQRPLWPAVLAAGLIIGSLAALAFYRWQPRLAVAETPPRVPPAERAATSEPAVPASAAAAGSAADEASLDRLVSDPALALERAVLVWADAWSHQSVDAYLDAYSDRFRPGDGQSRAVWAATRRQRLREPEFIRVTLEDFRIEQLLERSASVRFNQTYQSDGFSDRVEKRLRLVLEGDRWRIACEDVITA